MARRGWFGRQDDDEDDEPMGPGNPDQPPPAGLCPAVAGPHQWEYDGYTRHCPNCNARESV